MASTMSPSRSRPIVLLAWSLLMLLGCRAAPYAPHGPGRYGDEADPPPTWRTGDLPGSTAWTGPRHPEGNDGLYAYTDPGALPELRDAAGRALPLRHTAVHAALRGNIAAVQVWQRFHNDAREPLEVVYRFPLPENSAVSDLRMTIGERVIQADVMRREDARETFEGARVAGHTAALLEQERPNLFTQSVTNIAPGEDVLVEIRYLQTLTYDAGEYELVFPLVVGPRFSPDDASVPDAARLSAPIAGPGLRTGHDVSIEVDVQAGPPILSFTAPTHEVEGSLEGGRLHVHLAVKDRLPNRDFVLRYRVAGPEPSASVLLGERDAGGHGHYLMVVHPPAVDVDAVVGRREVLFVVDRSGSMSGPPLALAKQTVRELLARLRPVDAFDVVGFASGTERLFGRPRPANASNLVEALRFLDAMEGGGGTVMADAVQAALADEVAPGFNRYVLFLTDGWVGNEVQIFAGAQALVRRISRRGSVARVFGIGIGAAPNDFLLEGIATAGNGAARNITSREEPSQVVDAVMHDIDCPVLTGLALADDGPLRAESYPAEIPDLFVSQPVVVVGRYQGDVGDTVALRGQRSGVAVELEVPVQRIDDADALLQTLWARAKVEHLSIGLWHATDEGDAARTIEEITTLGLRHRLVTAHTSFVAVDGSRTIGSGHPSLVLQAVALPADAAPYGASGISLAGTTGAQSRYVVEGASVDTPSFGTLGASVVREYIEAPSPPAHGSPSVFVTSGRADLRGSIDHRALRAALRSQRGRLRRCVEGSPLYLDQGVRTLIFELGIDDRGHASVTLRKGSLGSEASDACVTRALEDMATTLPHGIAVTLPLRLHAH